jgi:hypothetical protein
VNQCSYFLGFLFAQRVIELSDLTEPSEFSLIDHLFFFLRFFTWANMVTGRHDVLTLDSDGQHS